MHATVIVTISPDEMKNEEIHSTVDSKLKPYCENLCDYPGNDAFPEITIDIFRSKKLYAGYETYKYTCLFNDTPEDEIEDFEKWVNYNYCWSVKDGKITMGNYNPNGKWDWWVIGGRWKEFFKHPTDGMVDVIQKGEWDRSLDIEDYVTSKMDQYDKIKEKFKNRVFPDVYRERSYTLIPEWANKGITTWFERGDYNVADEINKYFKFKYPNDIWIADVPELNLPRDKYEKYIRKKSTRSQALLHNGKWVDLHVWHTEVPLEYKDIVELGGEWEKLYDSIPNDYYLVLVDYHY